MKNFLLISMFLLLGWQMKAQMSATIAVQFYVDANNNCVYDPAEQLVYNVPGTFSYINSSGTVITTSFGYTASTCGATTVYAWSQPSVTPTNTININTGIGVSPNLACNNYNNLAYNTNTTYYLPVTLTGTSSVGANINYMYFNNGNGAFYNYQGANSSTIGICSNLGTDSVYMSINVYNQLNCNNSGSTATRTYSLYLDGVNYDVLTTTGGFMSSSNAIGVNAQASISEFYMASQTLLSLYTKLPATFSVLGTHTFEIMSSMIYNNAQSTLNFSKVINSVPCSKISGRFYNDCNNNCTYDAGDSYGVGYYAKGKVYNATTGLNLNFYPNPYDGKFSIYLPTNVSYSLTQFPTFTASPYNFTACTTGTTAIPAGAATNTFQFGYQNNSVNLMDPSVYLNRTSSTSTIISPGVGATFAVMLTNNWWNACGGATVNPGQLKVTLPKFINYISTLTGPTPTFVLGANVDTLIWAVPNFSNNGFISFCSFSVVVSSTAVPNSGFTISARITPVTDSYLLNNIFNWSRVIDGPFDPNGKTTEVAGLQSNGDVPFGADQFFYTIGFQNIGNAPAINVTTIDTMDINFDLSTLRVTQSSFPVSAQIDHVTRVVGFHFDGINLPGIASDEPGSHGFVRYAIKLKSGVPVNTVLKNRGHNYFDFNEPVATNQTSNKLVILTTGLNEFNNAEQTLRVIPNPFNNKLKVVDEKGIQNISVYNLVGDLIIEYKTNSVEANLNLENLSPAIYLLRVTSVEGRVSTVKVIKE